MRSFIFLFFAILFFCSCDHHPSKATETSEPPQKIEHVAYSPFVDSITPIVVEVTAEALPFWRQFKDAPPTLVILSDKSLFHSVPQPLAKREKALVNSGSRKDIWDSTPFTTADPVFMPGMGVRSALNNSFFSEIIWMLPVKEELQNSVTIDSIKTALRNMGSFNDQEISSIKHTETGFTGRILGKNLRIEFLGNKTKISNNVVIHFDLGYLKPFYRSEIKTPIYPLIHSVLMQIKAQNWNTLGVSITRSNYSERLPLTVRFLGTSIPELFSKPEIFDNEISEVSSLRRDILYLDNFFQPEKTLYNAKRITELAPDAAESYYDLYQALMLNKNYAEAVQALSKCIDIDPGYALQFLSLALQAEENKRYSMMADYLSKASVALPKNPFILFEQARSLILADKKQEAKVIINSLKSLPWSKTYYPDVRSQLERFSDD